MSLSCARGICGCDAWTCIRKKIVWKDVYVHVFMYQRFM
jgi:hypothetical protein